MRITFVLPGIATEPNGGVKIVYEYANRLARLGNEVTVVHPRTWEKMTGAVQTVKAMFWPISVKTRYGGAVPWVTLEPGVRQLLVPNLEYEHLPDADAVFATFFRTAPFVNALPKSKGNKFYLVQHYETWAGSKDDVDATWRLPMHKIVICLWLQTIAKEMGELTRSSHIPNGMDLETYKLRMPIEPRKSKVIMLLNSSEFKGSVDGIAALKLVREKVPDISAECFGTAPRLPDLPDWIQYKQLPSTDELVDLYNSGSIFLQCSHAEGWGLTSTEAMACGCALVSTDNGGSRDYALNEETALVTPIRDSTKMAESILRLLCDDSLRIRLAVAGQKYVQQFTWDRAVNSLLAALKTAS